MDTRRRRRVRTPRHAATSGTASPTDRGRGVLSEGGVLLETVPRHLICSWAWLRHSSAMATPREASRRWTHSRKQTLSIGLRKATSCTPNRWRNSTISNGRKKNTRRSPATIQVWKLASFMPSYSSASTSRTWHDRSMEPSSPLQNSHRATFGGRRKSGWQLPRLERSGLARQPRWVDSKPTHTSAPDESSPRECGS